MKTLIKSAIIGLALAGVAQATPTASYVTQNVTNSAITGTLDSGTSFTFAKFDSAMGNLTAVDLFVLSSTVQGNLTATRGTGNGTVKISNIGAALIIAGALGSGLDSDSDSQFVSDTLNLNRTPAGDQNLTSVAPSKTFNLVGTSQSIISATTPVVFDLVTPGAFSFSYYTGATGSTFSYIVANFLPLTQTNTGGGGATASVTSSNVLAPTTLQLRYTYTPSGDPSAVPEPGQVAASLLLLGGIGGYVFIKRRCRQAVAAA
jgi:hypothetical protein